MNIISLSEYSIAECAIYTQLPGETNHFLPHHFLPKVLPSQDPPLLLLALSVPPELPPLPFPRSLPCEDVPPPSLCEVRDNAVGFRYGRGGDNEVF